MATDQEQIRVCSNHAERLTPLIWTFAFPFCEWWCPHCGDIGAMFGTGRLVDSDAELVKRADEDKARSKEFLRAVTCKSDQGVELSDEQRARNAAAIAAWRYEGQREGATNGR